MTNFRNSKHRKYRSNMNSQRGALKLSKLHLRIIMIRKLFKKQVGIQAKGAN